MNNKNNEKIDLIVPWVDGSDPAWLEEKRDFDGSSNDNNSNSSQRYRDWNLMRYFFRGIEENMPWINKVFFVTWGHVPEWLDASADKLRIINHKDYIPSEYLPTFNSNTIELNFHRIEELSENFILFNDDMYIINKTNPEQFFQNGKCCDMLLCKTLVNYEPTAYIYHTVLNNMGIINKYYGGSKEAIKHFNKWVNSKYGLKNSFMNFMKMGNSRISTFYDFHLPIAHKKSIFKKLWELESNNLDFTCMNKFRSPLDLNHWLMRYWNLAFGNFIPVDVNKAGVYFDFYEKDISLKKICDTIEEKKIPIIVVNDTLDGSDNDTFIRYRNELAASLDKILPTRSSFERF